MNHLINNYNQTTMKKATLFLLALLLPLVAGAEPTLKQHLTGTAEVDGISYYLHRYKYDDGSMKYEAEVMSKSGGYAGEIFIPAEIHAKTTLFFQGNEAGRADNDFTVAGIRYRAFQGCESLTAVRILPMKTIGSEAFDGCTNLKEFSDYMGLTPVVETIEDRAFQNCKSLTHIDFSQKLTTIGFGAFMGCSGLDIISIPSSVTLVNNSAFEGCDGLKVVYYWPKKIFGSRAFYGCYNLKKFIVCHISNPPAIPENCFQDDAHPDMVYNNAVLGVPVGSLERYRETFAWSKFFKIIEEDVNPETGITGDLSGDGEVNRVYSLSGMLVKRGATSLKQLPRGIYIINGRKVVIK